MLRRFMPLWLVLIVMLTSCSQPTPPKIEVLDPWVRAAAYLSPEAGGNSALYMTITNTGGSPDRLIEVRSQRANMLELHETTITNDVMQMNPLPDGIIIPAQGQVELRPAGFHVMLMGITEEFAEGDTVRFTLVFEQSGMIEFEAPVRNI